MKKTTSIAPPYSLLFISDREAGIAPIPVRGAHIIWTPTCISISCFPSIDGKTRITIGHYNEFGDELRATVFDKALLFPSRELLVSTAEHETVLSFPVEASSARIRIWDNHPMIPDDIRIAVG